jgi:hypothetical protein
MVELAIIALAQVEVLHGRPGQPVSECKATESHCE